MNDLGVRSIARETRLGSAVVVAAVAACAASPASSPPAAPPAPSPPPTVDVPPEATSVSNAPPIDSSLPPVDPAPPPVASAPPSIVLPPVDCAHVGPRSPLTARVRCSDTLWGPIVASREEPFPKPPPSPPSSARAPRMGGQGAVMVNGYLPPEVVDRIVVQNRGRFDQCFEEGRERDPSLTGVVDVKLIIGRDGAVARTFDGGSTLPDGAVVACVARAMLGLSFPQPDGGIAPFVYRFRFGKK